MLPPTQWMLFAVYDFYIKNMREYRAARGWNEFSQVLCILNIDKRIKLLIIKYNDINY